MAKKLPKVPKPPATITVAQLREALSFVNPSAKVYLARDPEGNGFGPLPAENLLCSGRYDSSHPWTYGDFELDEKDADLSKAEAIALWPAV